MSGPGRKYLDNIEGSIKGMHKATGNKKLNMSREAPSKRVTYMSDLSPTERASLDADNSIISLYAHKNREILENDAKREKARKNAPMITITPKKRKP